ncbi:hypothetical protein [Streptomyces avicenniae]|nr:hypothetical protein [Streptomyces avicenniae]
MAKDKDSGRRRPPETPTGETRPEAPVEQPKNRKRERRFGHN